MFFLFESQSPEAMAAFEAAKRNTAPLQDESMRRELLSQGRLAIGQEPTSFKDWLEKLGGARGSLSDFQLRVLYEECWSDPRIAPEISPPLPEDFGITAGYVEKIREGSIAWQKRTTGLNPRAALSLRIVFALVGVAVGAFAFSLDVILALAILIGMLAPAACEVFLALAEGTQERRLREEFKTFDPNPEGYKQYAVACSTYERDIARKVFVSRSGKYHPYASCHGMSWCFPVSKWQADRRGYVPCNSFHSGWFPPKPLTIPFGPARLDDGHIKHDPWGGLRVCLFAAYVAFGWLTCDTGSKHSSYYRSSQGHGSSAYNSRSSSSNGTYSMNELDDRAYQDVSTNPQFSPSPDSRGEGANAGIPNSSPIGEEDTNPSRHLEGMALDNRKQEYIDDLSVGNERQFQVRPNVDQPDAQDGPLVKPPSTHSITKNISKGKSVGAPFHSEGGYFTLGSSEEQVRAVQGTPTAISGERWSYSFSSVEFENHSVVAYSNASDNLLVRVLPRTESHAKFFTLGSGTDDVLTAQGTPSSISGDRWSYGFSSIEFERGVVVAFSDASKNLVVAITPKVRSSLGFFSLNSSRDEVLSVQGTPSAVDGDRWSYEFSSIEFSNGKVIGYSDASDNLKVRLVAKAKTRKSSFTIGSTVDEVLSAQGTPTGISDNRWSYGFSSVTFADGRGQHIATHQRI